MRNKSDTTITEKLNEIENQICQRPTWQTMVGTMLTFAGLIIGVMYFLLNTSINYYTRTIVSEIKVLIDERIRVALREVDK